MMITKFDFFQDFYFKLYFWVLDIHSKLKMCTFEIYYVYSKNEQMEGAIKLQFLPILAILAPLPICLSLK